jgi:hypothetical protein
MKKLILALTLLTFIAVLPVVLADSIPSGDIGTQNVLTASESAAVVWENSNSQYDRIDLISGWFGDDDDNREPKDTDDPAVVTPEPSTAFLVLSVASICAILALRRPRLG